MAAVNINTSADISGTICVYVIHAKPLILMSDIG